MRNKIENIDLLDNDYLFLLSRSHFAVAESLDKKAVAMFEIGDHQAIHPVVRTIANQGVAHIESIFRPFTESGGFSTAVKFL